MPSHNATRPTESDRAHSAAFVTTLQQPDGSFAWVPGQPGDLGATSTALRVFTECGTLVPRRDDVLAYVESCFDTTTHGFSLTPGGQISLHSIAEGHVALVALQASSQQRTRGLDSLVDPLVRTPFDVWIAAAFLDTAGVAPSAAARWAETVLAERHPDGSWGQGAARAVQTAMHASSLLLLGMQVPDVFAVRDVVLQAQTPAGGWPDPDAHGQPTLAATYRVARVLRMLSIPADLAAVNAFTAQCRRPHGGYAAAPDDEHPDLVNTYLALTIDRWLNEPDKSGIN